MGGGKKKRQRSQRELSDEEFDAAIAEFEDGSDRVGAVMGAALVENALDDAIISFLKDASNAAKLFDDVKGPFNTFYAKTLAARALGLIDADQETSLHAIRSVRNRFAHDLISIDFNEAGIAAKCETLKQYRTRWKLKEREIPETRRFYECACYTLTLALMEVSRGNLQRKQDGLIPKGALAQYMGLGGLLDALGGIPPNGKGGE